MTDRGNRRRKRERAKRKKTFGLVLFVLFIAILLFLRTNLGIEEDVPVVDVLSSKEEGMLEEIETSGAYPADLVDTARKFPETVRFVHHYLHDKTAVPRPDEGGKVPHYLQWDTRWGYKPYCETFFASAGCGPTAMAMAVRGANPNATVLPYEIAEKAEALGYAIPDVGTDVLLFPHVAPEYDVECLMIEHNPKIWKRVLEAGGTIILNVGPGDFTNYGHFIVLTEYRRGKFFVLDPNSITRSKFWSYETLERQTKYAWSMKRNL